MRFTLVDFLRESNRIEGIHRAPSRAEIDATAKFGCKAVGYGYPTTAEQAADRFAGLVAKALLSALSGEK